MLSIKQLCPPPEGTRYQLPKKGVNKSYKKGKVNNPNEPSTGWPDIDGNVWVSDNNMDSGPGWVVQHPDGSHHHVYPNGKVRSHSSSSSINWDPVIGVVLVGGAIVGTVYVLGNDLSIVGILDDAALLPPIYATFNQSVSLILQ
jgi:hypothetical protein